MSKVITKQQIKDALRKDFNALYTKQFTTAWEATRIVRSMELNIMPLDNLLKLIKESEKE